MHSPLKRLRLSEHAVSDLHQAESTMQCLPPLSN